MCAFLSLSLCMHVCMYACVCVCIRLRSDQVDEAHPSRIGLSLAVRMVVRWYLDSTGTVLVVVVVWYILCITCECITVTYVIYIHTSKLYFYFSMNDIF